jgi:hypothetical protein
MPPERNNPANVMNRKYVEHERSKPVLWARMKLRAAGAIACILLSLAGCTGSRPGGAAAPLADADLERQCLGLMYATRSTQGRGSPNWAIHDQCIRQHHP